MPSGRSEGWAGRRYGERVNAQSDEAVRVGVLGARGRMGTEVCRAVDAADDLELVAMVDDRATTRMMNRNTVHAVLVIPSGLGRELQSGRTAPVQLLLNGDNANTATTVMGYALTILRLESAKYQPRGAGAPEAPLLSVEQRVWYNPELRSTLFLVPGLIAYIAMITAVVYLAVNFAVDVVYGVLDPRIRVA